MAEESESATRLSFAVVAHVPNRIVEDWIFEVVGERAIKCLSTSPVVPRASRGLKERMAGSLES